MTGSHAFVRHTITAMCAVVATFAASTEAQTLGKRHLWVTDGNVRCQTQGNGVLYLGGDFEYVGPPTGNAALVSAEDGALIDSNWQVFGRVDAAVDDGTGGWIMGGEFTRIGETQVDHFARVLADGSVVPLPSTNGPVRALCRVGDTVYVGGDFSMIGATPRNNAAAVDLGTNALLPWNPNVTMPIICCLDGVLDLFYADGQVIIAGNFARIGGQTRRNIGRVDAITAALDAWDPDVDFAINEVGQRGNTLYLGGVFTNVGNQARNRVAAVSMSTGAPTAFNPNSNGHVHALKVTDSAVYLGGIFSMMGGQSRLGAAAVHPVSGALLSWHAMLDVNSVSALALGDGVVYLGGNFDTSRGLERMRMVAVDPVVGIPTGWQANAGGRAHAIVPAGDSVFVGGEFSSIGGVVRHFIAALDLETGEATPFNPDANGSVTDLELVGDTIFAVGGFADIGGAQRLYAAELSTATGLATSFNPPGINIPPHNAVAVTADYVYVGGDFSNIGGRAQGGLAELDRTTGALTPRNVGTEPAIGISVDALTFDSEQNLLYAGGFFSLLAGQNRFSLGAIDVNSGQATAWHPNVFGRVQCMDLAGDTLYIGGDFDRVGGVDRLNAAAVSTEDASLLGWNPTLTGGDGFRGTTLSIVVATHAIYAGGAFTRVDGELHLYAAAFDHALGTQLEWDPQLFGEIDLLATGYVYDIDLVNGDAFIVGDFVEAVGAARRGFAVTTSLETLFGDVDGNGVLNLADHTAFTDCLTGPDAIVSPPCHRADLDGDQDADLDDFATLQPLLVEPN